MRQYLPLLCLVLGSLALCIESAAVVNKDAKNFELLILHNNDMHARFEQTSKLSSTCSESDSKNEKCYGGFARVATKVQEARENAKRGGPPVLYLNAGDTYTGTVWFTVYKWEIAAAFINMLKPDAVSLGNHEFDNGISGLTPFVENLTCPVLCANIDLKNEPELEKEPNLMKSIVLNVNGTKIGIIGYLTPDTAFLVSPNNVKYENEVSAIQREADRLTNEGIKILIALGHSGYETDMRIAKEVKGIDLVVGGHTNTFLWNGAVPDSEERQGPYPTVIEQNLGTKRRVPVVQAYAYTKYLGRIHLTFDSEGELVEHDGLPILLNSSVVQDKAVLNLLETYRPGIEALRKEVVGNTKVILGGNSTVCRVDECNIGNMLADAMVHAYVTEYHGAGWTDAPIALLQGGGIRSSIEATDVNGNITRADLMNVMPFDNAIVAVNISGRYLRAAFERSVHDFNLAETPGAFLQVSGVYVTYNLAKEKGQRVVSVAVRCGACDVPSYSPLDDKAYYKVLMPSYMYDGGDGYDMFKNNSISNDILTFNDVESAVMYLSSRNPVYPEIGGRIMFNGAVLVAAFNPLLAVMCLVLLNAFK